MAKQSGGKPQIDEDFMKEIISQGLPVKKKETPTVTVKTEIETPDKPDDKTGTVETADKPEIKAESKEEKALKEPARRKKNTPGDYRETYFMRVDLMKLLFMPVMSLYVAFWIKYTVNWTLITVW